MPLLQPIMPEFNQAVTYITRLLIPEGFDTTPDESLVSSLDKVTQHYEHEGRILVWSGASDNTIYQDADVNHQFRAWHDWLHIGMQATFTKAGEANVCEKHKRQIDLYLSHKYNKATRLKMHRLLDIEINGQVAELYNTGKFVTNQYNFTKERL